MINVPGNGDNSGEPMRVKTVSFCRERKENPMRNVFLPLVAQICEFSGFVRLCQMYGGLGLILMFHRFTTEPEKRVDNNGVASGQFLNKLLGHIKRSGQEIIPLRDVPGAIAERRRFICLTIDDGYRDNVEVALPILRRHKAPATIFVPSGVLDRSLDAWWLQVEELAKKHPHPQSAYLKMISMIDRNPALLAQMRNSFAADQEELNEKYFMNAREIKTIAQDPLIDIGGHTITHPRLRSLPADMAYYEIAKNKDDLEKLLDREIDTFAYPFGNSRACGPREFALVEKAGYKVAVTTRDGNVLPNHEGHLTALPRYSVRGQFERLAIYELQRSGTYRALKSRFGPTFVTG